MSGDKSHSMQEIARLMEPQGYKLLDFLGGGGMGEVYKAMQVNLDRIVAIKIAKPSAQGSPEQQNPRRLLHEAKTIAKLDHSGIVRVYDCFVWEGQVAIVMEYMDGRTLAEILENKEPGELEPAYREMLAERGRLKPEWTIRIGTQIAEALYYSHGLKITHRDIKPSNIFIGRVGGVKLFDFSIAQDQKVTGLTAAGLIVGSPPYMSPEQVRGENIDGRSDIYSLGCVLFHCTTGETPFRDTSQIQICIQHLQQPVPDPLAMAPQTPIHLARCILKCLEKDRESRFATGMDLARALQSSTASFGMVNQTAEVPPQLLQQIVSKSGSSHRIAGKKPAADAGNSPASEAPTETKPRHSKEVSEARTETLSAVKAPPASGASGKLVGVALLLAVLGGGGYFAYQKMTPPTAGPAPEATNNGSADIAPAPKPKPATAASPSPTPAIATATPSSTPTAAPTPPPSATPEPTPPPTPIPGQLDLLRTWSQRGADAGRWVGSKVTLAAGADPKVGGIVLKNENPYPVEVSWLVQKGHGAATWIDYEDSWALHEQADDLAGKTAGAAFGDAPVTLRPGEAKPFLPWKPAPDVAAKAWSSRLAFEEVTLAALKTGAASPGKGGVVAEPANAASVPVTWSAPTGDAATKALMAAMVAASRASGGDELPGGVVALRAEESGQSMLTFLQETGSLAGQGLLAAPDSVGFKRGAVDRWTGSVGLVFESFVTDVDMDVDVIVVRGSQEVRIRNGTQKMSLRRGLAGLTGHASGVHITQFKGEFTVPLPKVLKDGPEGDALTYDSTGAVELGTVLVRCSVAGANPAGRAPQAPYYDRVLRKEFEGDVK